MSHKVLRKSGELHYLACEWGKRLLRYLHQLIPMYLVKALRLICAEAVFQAYRFSRQK